MSKSNMLRCQAYVRFELKAVYAVTLILLLDFVVIATRTRCLPQTASSGCILCTMRTKIFCKYAAVCSFILTFLQCCGDHKPFLYFHTLNAGLNSVNWLVLASRIWKCPLLLSLLRHSLDMSLWLDFLVTFLILFIVNAMIINLNGFNCLLWTETTRHVGFLPCCKTFAAVLGRQTYG